MKNRYLILTGIVVIALLCSVGSVTALVDSSTGAQGADGISDTIDPYNGPIGAESPLFGLKLAMENLDETFTFNDTLRVEKQLDHGRIRIAEVQRELQRNRPDIAETALEQYRQKLDLTERSLRPFTKNTSGLIHAQEKITKHEEILANLILQYPNNTGLIRAYDNSHSLELKFEDKTEMRFTRFTENGNKTILKAVRFLHQERSDDDNSNAVKNTGQERNQKQEKITEQKNEKGVNTTVTAQSMPKHETPAGDDSHRNDSESSQDQGKKGRD
jgi:hypothetical protein